MIDLQKDSYSALEEAAPTRQLFDTYQMAVIQKKLHVNFANF